MTAARLRRAATLVGAVLALSLVAGCTALLAPPPAEIHKSVLDKLPSDLPQRASRGAVLLVFPPQGRPVYDTAQMAYTIRPYDIAFFSQHEWAEPPARMLEPLLVKTLQATGSFRAVLAPPYAARYNYALRTELRELVADFTSEPAAVQLSLRFELSEGTAGRIVAVKELSIREPLRAKTPYAGVIAANDAVAKALAELASFVLERTGG